MTTKVMLPAARPQRPREWTVALLKAHGVTEALSVLGVRGYYRDTMGAPGVNDRGIYDDAIMVVSPNVYATFNANTDPSIRRANIASLLPGVWWYQKGKHHPSKPTGYWAFTQASPVTVVRDDNDDPDDEPQLDTGWFGINIHRGGNTTTGSEGCQTIPPGQWDAFRELVYGELRRTGQKTFPYCLVETVG